MSRIKILIVEDEAIVAQDIKSLVESLGYEPVGIAATGEDAIALAHATLPDLVLMDVSLRGEMDGITAAQSIREQLGIPVVFLTAFAADDVLARANLVEPFGYILKPFSDRDISTVLAMAVYKCKSEARLRNASLHMQTILDNMVDGVITIDDHGRVQSFNKAACTIFGYEAGEVMDRNISMLMPQHHRERHDGYLAKHRATGEEHIIGHPRELEGRRKDGDIFPMSLAVSKAVHEGAPLFIGLIRDISKVRKDAQEIHRLAFYDPLTSLPNRRLLMDRVGQALLGSARTAQHGALLFLDLDHFKSLNDTLGHDVGDELLRNVAQRLASCLREGDSVARLGGDEFVVLLENLNSHGMEAATQAEGVAAKILQSLGQPYELTSHAYNITTSIGIALFMGNAASIDELFKKSDLAMYQAKSAGRNTWRFFDPNLQALAAAHAEKEKDLRRGFANSEFVLHYQLQVRDDFGDLHGMTPTGAEALVRWNHPSRGTVSPAEFIPLAEETGVILALGQWVLEEACAQLKRWANSPVQCHWTIAVNVSAIQFSKADFVENVFHALDKTGANANLLKLELTESMLAVDIELIIFKMHAIRSRGVSFSLDDFGTGYSSLSYLKRLPLAQLKIDKSFVFDVLTDPSDAAIANTIIALGHSLGLKVIAEGVETLGQLEFLSNAGCDAFQGFYFGRPKPAENFEESALVYSQLKPLLQT